jgi:hypothetical protein
MLRVEIRKSTATWHIVLEGRFTGGDANHMRMLITRSPVGIKLIVDLTEVVFIDNVGEDILSFLGRFGAVFVAPNSYLLDVCERMNLPVARNGASPDTNVRKTLPSGPREPSK